MECEKKDCIYQPLSVNCVNCGSKHINYQAEISRQSVTDNEIQEAIEWLEHLKGCWVGPDIHNLYDLAIDAIRAYKPEPWIPVSESLPETDIGVLVWAGYRDIGWIDWKEKKWRREGGWFSDGQITHWMPLPEPPLGGDRK